VTKLAAHRDGIRITFEPDEVEALRDLAGQLEGLLSGGVPTYGTDPIRDRLFPRAYVDPTEDRAESDFQSVVHDELVRAKSEALAALVDDLDGEGRIAVELDETQIEQWVAALNDVRLAVGTAIGVTEDDVDLADDDPRAFGFATYDWLTWLQGSLVEALLERP
jgi:hypothetical protein